MRISLILIFLFFDKINAQPYPDIAKFLPDHCVKGAGLRIDFEGDGMEELALSYEKEGPRDKDGLLYFPENAAKEDIWNSGLMILKYSDSLGWVIAYDEKTFTGNETGVWGAPKIAIISGTTSKKKGLLVVTEHSGAGSATGWEILISIQGKIVHPFSEDIRNKFLKDRGYKDHRYNSITSTEYLIIETIPGWTAKASRASPDRPKMDMVFQLSNDSLILKTVVEGHIN